MSDIRFSADPSSVLRAMQDIQHAIQRAGQEGKAFSDMDLSHPELKDLERDMSRLRSSMLALQRISPGSQFARGLRDSGQAGKDPWAVDWQQAFPEQQQRQRALHRLVQGSGHVYGTEGHGGHPPGGGGFAGLPGAGPAGAMMRSMVPLAPVMAALKQHLTQGPVLQIDETPVQVLDKPGRANTTKSYMWVYRGGPPSVPVIWFQYAPSRSGDVPIAFLFPEGGPPPEHRFYLQTDGYAGYHALAEQDGILGHMGCWAHVRRKAVEAANPSEIAVIYVGEDVRCRG